MNRIVPAAEPVGRLLALDGLRGLAALLVVFYHVGWPNHLTNSNFVRNGYLAVDLFFILSGFVIFQNYADRIRSMKDARDFMCLRFFRIYPLHFVTLALLGSVELLKLLSQNVLLTPSEQAPFTGNNSIPALVANIFLVQGLHTLAGSSWNIPSWSISCEFAAYLVFGVASLTGVIRRRLFFPLIFLVAGCAYSILAFEYDGLDATYDWGGVRCLAGFFLGAMVAQLNRLPGDSLARPWLDSAAVATLVAIIVVMQVASGPAVVLVIPLFVIAIALLRTDQGPAVRILTHSSMQYLGRVSYSIYMIQFPIIIFLMIVLKRLFKVPLFQDPNTQRFTLLINPWLGDLLVLGSVGAVLVIASISYAWIESPGRAFGRRLVRRGSGRLTVKVRPAD